MRIPMTQIQAASISALPQQASREARSPSSAAASDPGQIELQIDEKLEKSTETGDRDAQEQYQQQNKPSKNPNEPASPSTSATQQHDSASNSIWNLAVADDQPPPDLDIRG